MTESSAFKLNHHAHEVVKVVGQQVKHVARVGFRRVGALDDGRKAESLSQLGASRQAPAEAQAAARQRGNKTTLRPAAEAAAKSG